MAEPIEAPSVEDLVGCRIVTSQGDALGHVIDVAIRRDTLEVVGVLYGAATWLYRLAAFKKIAQHDAGAAKPRLIPWSAVASCDRYVLALKPGGEHAIRDFEI